MSQDDIARMSVDELAASIRTHQQAYYRGKTEMSDAEFDGLWDELLRRNPEHPLLHTVGSDTEVKGKVAHIMHMHSQEKARNAEELLAWAQKREIRECIAEHKLDGVSIELQYEQGRFVIAATRGDGVYGDNVTDNITRIAGFPTRIDKRFSGAVRGEIILPIALHRKHYPQFANCRNTAAGIIKRKDGVGCEYLQMIFYDAKHGDNEGYFADNHAILRWLKKAQFSVVEWRRVAVVADIVEWYAELTRARATLPYDIDGLVVKTLPIMADDRALAKPKYQIAFKFTAEERTTRLKEVLWSQSGHLYTPIAVTDPVQIAGTTVQRANLVNMRLIRGMGIHIGAEVVISKRGEIIPKIERMVRAAAEPIEIVPPLHCTSCDTSLIVEDTRVHCPNIKCPRRVIHHIRRWIEVLEIKEFGEILIRDLYQAGAVESVADIYRLETRDITKIERQGEQSAKNALRNLHRVQSMSLAKFVAALNIENIGEKTMQKLIDSGYTSVESLYAMRPEDVVQIDGIGEIMATHICKSIAENRENIERIIEASAIRITHEERSDTLVGKHFCFTGPLRTMSRKEAQESVRRHGGQVSDAITRSITHLVTNNPDSATAKLRQARAYGITIIDEEQFLQPITKT